MKIRDLLLHRDLEESGHRALLRPVAQTRGRALKVPQVRTGHERVTILQRKARFEVGRTAQRRTRLRQVVQLRRESAPEAQRDRASRHAAKDGVIEAALKRQIVEKKFIGDPAQGRQSLIVGEDQGRAGKIGARENEGSPQSL